MWNGLKPLSIYCIDPLHDWKIHIYITLNPPTTKQPRHHHLDWDMSRAIGTCAALCKSGLCGFFPRDWWLASKMVDAQIFPQEMVENWVVLFFGLRQGGDFVWWSYVLSINDSFPGGFNDRWCLMIVVKVYPESWEDDSQFDEHIVSNRWVNHHLVKGRNGVHYLFVNTTSKL